MVFEDSWTCTCMPPSPRSGVGAVGLTPGAGAKTKDEEEWVIENLSRRAMTPEICARSACSEIVAAEWHSKVRSHINEISGAFLHIKLDRWTVRTQTSFYKNVDMVTCSVSWITRKFTFCKISNYDFRGSGGLADMRSSALQRKLPFSLQSSFVSLIRKRKENCTSTQAIFRNTLDFRLNSELEVGGAIVLQDRNNSWVFLYSYRTCEQVPLIPL